MNTPRMFTKRIPEIHLLILMFLACAGVVGAQTSPQGLNSVLSTPLQGKDDVAFQVREYLMNKVTKFKAPADAEQWSAEEGRLRKHWLDDVVFHGWPRDWVNSPPKFEDAGSVPGGVGYKMRKLRYEIVPGFWSTAILYEPDNINGKVPAILNVNGHDYVLGKAAEYKQKRCINYAKRGIIALSLEWLECGELYHPEEHPAGNRHWGAAYLDFVGANSVGLFYLAMRRGLDYLYALPEVDQSRIGMTGLSGGGWQTITLSALDPRVAVAVPVAGYTSMFSEVERLSDTGDIEQIPTDFFVSVDNVDLTALRAPRATMLIFNDEDNCCFRAPLVKPYVYDQVLPVFKLYGKGGDFQWHDNQDPGTHNYQLDNRLHAYRFFSEYLRIPAITSEIPVGSELKSYQELAVGLPKDNDGFLELAKQMAAKIERTPVPQDTEAKTQWEAQERSKIAKLIRYSPVEVKHAWAVSGFKAKGIVVKSYRFEFNNDLSATGNLLQAVESPENAPAVVILNDNGRTAAAEEVSDRVNREEKVLAVDLIFTGDSAPPKTGAMREYFIQMLATLGDRALGIEVAQLLATAQWLAPDTGRVELDCTGIRSQMVALLASAIQPGKIERITIRKGVSSLSRVLTDPVPHIAAPELFCLDLYKETEIDQLTALAESGKASVQYAADADAR